MKKPRIDKAEQIPQFAEVILNWSPGGNQFETTFEIHRCLGTFGGHIDRLGFVQHNRLLHLGQHLGHFFLLQQTSCIPAYQTVVVVE